MLGVCVVSTVNKFGDRLSKLESVPRMRRSFTHKPDLFLVTSQSEVYAVTLFTASHACPVVLAIGCTLSLVHHGAFKAGQRTRLHLVPPAAQTSASVPRDTPNSTVNNGAAIIRPSCRTPHTCHTTSTFS